MDPISVLGLVFTAVQLTSSCLKECRKFIGPSKHSSAYVQSIAGDLWAFNGSLRNLQTHYDIYEDGQARSIALSSMEKPLSDCKYALELIREHLESNKVLGKYVIGVHFDTALRRHLSCLKNSRILFHEVLQADQIVLLHAVEKYIRNFAEDIRDLQNTISESEGRSRRDFERMHLSLGSIRTSQEDILHSYEDSKAREESGSQGNHLSDVTFQLLTKCLAQKDRTIIDWLSPLNFWAKQSDVLSSRSGSTGTWILETEEFKDWAAGSGKTLWCTGIPGAGKTVFTSTVVDHLSRRVKGPRVAISCVYCSYKDEAIQTPTSLIASVLQQVLRKRMVVSDDLRTLYERHELNKTRPTVKELSVQLQASVHSLEKFFVVIDALDECPDVKREEFLDHIRKLQPMVNLMITTRPASHIANGFPEAACVEIRAKDTDIQSYCEAKIRYDHRLQCVQDDANLRNDVINTIADNAQEMFLLAVLHMESLASQLNKAQVRKALKKLPKKLDDTYLEALQRIARQGESDVEVANQVLSWISYAYRPLTIEELRCALAVTPGDTLFDEEAMTPMSILVSICAGLVTFDPQSGIIRLVHYTTQEFFEKIRDSRFPTAQAQITRTCLTYLSFDHPSYYDTRYASVLHDIESSPFLGYAAQHWRDHMRANPEINFDELILQLLSQPKKVQCMLQAMDEDKLNESDIYKDPNVPPLCAATILGLETVLLLQLESGVDLTESVMSDGRTALHTAVFLAQLEVIRILIDHGASVNSPDRFGRTPLSETVCSAYMTSEKRAVAAARLLLDREADVDIQGGMETTSTLMDAVEWGYPQLVELLLTYGADVHLRDDRGFTALHLANDETPRIFQLLVDHGADLNARDNDGNSVLLYVPHGGSGGKAEDTARMLLDLGADIHSRNNSGETALFRAATQGHCRVIQVLMEYGADIHARNELGRPVLFSTIESKYGRPDEVVPLLLDLGADCRSQDSAGDTALARAAANGLPGTVRLILDHEADIDTGNRAGDTALTLAAAAEVKLEKLERFDAKYNRIDPALAMAAAVERFLITMELLLNYGAKIDTRNGAGDSALTLAAANGKLGAVKLLLDHGANAHVKNEAGDTALSLTHQNGHSEVHQLLLERLSEPNQPPGDTEAE